MQKIGTDFKDLYILQSKIFSDDRGSFIKTYNQSIFKNLNIDIDIKERYFSVSQKNVIRGMHFQAPPDDHVKLVNVLYGSIIDVVLDIRSKSETYGNYFKLKLSANDGKTLYIPAGFAHGFLALEDNTVVEYNQTTEYAPDNDTGIHYNSFGYNWEVKNPIVSDRDKSLLKLEQIKKYF